jgi:beta-xylosidase
LFLAVMMLAGCRSAKQELYMFTSFHEPANEGLRYLYSEDGVHWDSIPGVWLKPEIGKQKVMRDPSIVRTPDGVYHLVWTTSWRGDLGFGYAESKDLINWSEERMLNVMAHDTTTVNVWAPELFYDDEQGQMMIVWSSCVPYKFEKGAEDELNNHRLYYTTTKDFKTFSETKLLMDPGYSVIDATLLKRGKEDYVMVLKDNTRPNRNIQVAFAKSPYGPWSRPSKSFTGFLTEGPSVANTDGGYVIYYDDYRKKTYGAVRTADFKSFEQFSDSITIPEGHKHGTVFRAPRSVVEKLLKNKK